MFTGIVAAVGKIAAVAPKGDGLRLVVAPGALDIADVAIGDSVAVNGCCLTVVAKSGATLGFDVSAETLACTAGLDGHADVNLEKSLRLVRPPRRTPDERSRRRRRHGGRASTASRRSPPAPGSFRLEIDAPPALARFIAVKGSIAVHGVSLTVNGVAGARFHVNLIPHTLDVTTLRGVQPGAKVNLEVDLVARYVERLARFDRP